MSGRALVVGAGVNGASIARELAGRGWSVTLAEQHSPGTVLQYLALEHLFAQGEQGMFDFGEGETEQKKLFGTHSALCADVYMLRATPGNLGRVALRVLLESTSSAIVWVLERAGIKRWMKRAMRRSATAKAAE